MIRFLFAGLLLTTNLYPSAPSAAADVKAHHARDLPHKTETDRVVVPAEVVTALTTASDDPSVRAAQIKTIATWVDQDPEHHKNGAWKDDFLAGDTRIIGQIIIRAFQYGMGENAGPASINNEFRTYLPRILALKPNVGYRYTLGQEDSDLGLVISQTPGNSAMAQSGALQLETAKQVMVLLREQGISDERIYAEIDKRIKSLQEAIASSREAQSSALFIQYKLDIAQAAKAYLNDLRAAEKAAKIAEEELKKYLLPELSPIAAEYVAPLRKKDAAMTTKPATPKV